MAGIGPVPKRSDQRIRRNKPEIPIDKVQVIGDVEIPDLDLEDPHPLVQDLYDSMRHSGQAQFYEPSDWNYARIVLQMLSDQLHLPKPNANLTAALFSSLSDLLVAEGQRRRVRMEVERAKANDAKVIDFSEMLREKMTG